MTDYCSLYVTVPGEDEGLRIDRILLKEKRIACANISAPVKSLYVWQGDICEDVEHAMILKTLKSKSSQVMQRIKQLHSYDTPCIVQWDITEGDADYLRWIGESVEK